MAILVVAILHALLFLLIWQSRQLLIVRDAPADRFIEWIRIDPRRNEPVPSSPRERTIELQQPASPQPSTAPAPESLPPRQTDWNAHGAYAAKKAIEGSVSEPYRNFGPRKPGSPTEPDAPALFEEEEDMFGEEGTDVHNDPVVWLSKHCYQELAKTVRTARDWANPRPLLTQCVYRIGSPEPRGDLFEHLKKDRPLPAPKEDAPQELPPSSEP